MFSEDYSNNSLVLLTDLTSVEEEKYDYSGTPDVVIYLQLHTRVYGNHILDIIDVYGFIT